jgi:hypothetical protein
MFHNTVNFLNNRCKIDISKPQKCLTKGGKRLKRVFKRLKSMYLLLNNYFFPDTAYNLVGFYKSDKKRPPQYLGI